MVHTMEDFRTTRSRHTGRAWTVQAAVIQKTVDLPDESAHGFHVALDDGAWVTVRRDRVCSKHF